MIIWVYLLSTRLGSQMCWTHVIQTTLWRRISWKAPTAMCTRHASRSCRSSPVRALLCSKKPVSPRGRAGHRKSHNERDAVRDARSNAVAAMYHTRAEGHHLDGFEYPTAYDLYIRLDVSLSSET
ncbi:uncharacterized protein MYCGRDRAFT_105227 [Zymoseptoria tritici IPO323]|uniref:Uncharacterized protein n=1 Tax=Zymoseptoria tritici (strain CBS 115943 / IPO323) TaxID=336722 RepID=F9XFX3_ZYMTI|nr:uncharacterized protein MYCGRDRAFT_105227 [Zymoseptoria tritici IPO323]EGP86105.1 hypothetical protein MYCGRDRAFT_105227 [Zymoseptoria tritici IPO323]